MQQFNAGTLRLKQVTMGNAYQPCTSTYCLFYEPRKKKQLRVSHLVVLVGSLKVSDFTITARGSFAPQVFPPGGDEQRIKHCCKPQAASRPKLDTQPTALMTFYWFFNQLFPKLAGGRIQKGSPGISDMEHGI